MNRFCATQSIFHKQKQKDELLKDVEKLSWDELRSEFREEYVVLERQLFNLVQNEKRLMGKTLTGEVMADLISKYAEAVTSKDGIITELSQCKVVVAH